MSSCAVSTGVASTHRILRNNDDILEFALFNPRGKFAYLPCRNNLKQPLYAVQLLTIGRRVLMRTTLPFAIPSESDGTEVGRSHDVLDDRNVMRSENDESCKFSDVEVIAAVTGSEEGISQSVENVRNQGILLDKLKAVRLHVLASEQWNASQLKLCHRHYLESATNLIHYLALKCLDVELLKDDLSSVGLLNLETINSYILSGLTSGIQLLENLKPTSVKSDENTSSGIFRQKRLYQEKFRELTLPSMRKKQYSNKELLLGPLQGNRRTHIMVTIDREATESESFVTDLLKAGASIIRINCAHGNPSIWNDIIRRVKRSSQMLETPCRILMDLAGPKLRTGKLKPGPCVVKISPKKDATGNVIFPAQVWLSHKEAGPLPAHLSPDAILSIDDQDFISEIKVGDSLKFYDARGKKRILKISRQFHVFSGTGFVAECTRTAYVQSGTEFYIKGKKRMFPVGKVVDVPAAEPFVRLRVGDLLIISRDSSCEHNESHGTTNNANMVSCSSGYLFDSVKPGDPIAFDDGKIWGVIQGASMSEIVVSITHAGPRGTKLGSEKSINIPESNIWFEGLTSKDLMDLDFVASHADMVGISFVRDIRDIVVLCKELEKRKLQNLGVVLKIETKSGFEKLPLMLLEAMKCPNPLGVMIARGDLAVECGWEKLADMQEEILSVCSAAHVPVIWATQVLESLVKSGVPTRAEITDAANGRRASCVMLNKGKNVVEAVSTLDTILHNKTAEMKADLKPLQLSSYLF